jgi:hypothetical protein
MKSLADRQFIQTKLSFFVHSYDAGIRVVWKRRSVGYFVGVYAAYARDVNEAVLNMDEE